MDSIPFIPIVTAVAACLLYVLYQKALPKPIPGIPYDEAAAKSIFGSLPSMITYMRKQGVVMPWLTGHNDKHRSPLVQFFGAPFAKPTIILSDYAEAQDVLLRRTKEFDRAKRSAITFEDVIPEFHIGMRSTSTKFKGNKELIRDLMSPSFLHDVSSHQVHAKSLVLVDLWSEKASIANGKPFEAHQDIVDAALDIINAAAFAFDDELDITKQKLRNLQARPQDAVQEDSAQKAIQFSHPPIPSDVSILQHVSTFLGELSTSPFPKFSYRYRTLTDGNLRRNIALKDKIIRNHIEKCQERLARENGTLRSATDFMIQREISVARKENRDPNVYSRRILDELFGYILAGHETTSTALAWMVKLLADHQDVQNRLRQALTSALTVALSESRQPTALEIAKTNIPYLDAVLEESLRIATPTPMVARETIVDTVLLGHRIPKGVTVLFNNVGPGFRTKPIDIPDAVRSETSLVKNRTGTWDADTLDVFDPNRWLKKDENGEIFYDSQAGPFMTFSLGPRGCFGKRLAYLEMRLVLSLLLWNFRFKKLEGELASYDTRESVTVMPKRCYVSLERVRA